MTKAELKKLRDKLVRIRAQILGSVNSLRQEALGDKLDGSSRMPTHMADIGSDNFEQELNLGLMENEATQLQDIEDAITRVDEGSYGICEACNGKIPKARIEALPFVRNCIGCQRKSESQ